MKKLALLLLTAMLVQCLSGCGSSAPSKERPSHDIPQAPVSSDTQPEEPPEPEPYELDLEDRMKTFSYDVSSTFEKVTETNTNYYYPPDTESTLLQVMYSVSAPIDYTDPDTAAEVLEQTISGLENSSVMFDMTAEYDLTVAERPAARFSCTMYVGTTRNPALGLILLDANGILSFVATAPQEDDPLMVSFDSIVDSIRPYVPEQDFFSDETNRNTVNDSLYTHNFDQIISAAETYIAEQNPAETDSVFSILDYAQQGQQILANCTVVTDEFEGENTIYGSVQEISSSVNFVPYLDDSIANSKIRVIAGFEKNDWLFMETVKIKVGEDDYIKDYFDYFDVTRETLGGSTILEEVEYSLSYEEVEQLLAATDPVIRFEGENDATYDHQMTTEELTSLQTMYDLSTCTEEIWNILNQWTQDNMY